jgi:hypothetical protein
MSLAATPSNERQHLLRGLATLRRLRQDLRSAFFKDPQATSNAACSGPAPSIYTERLLSGNRIRVLHVYPSSRRHRQLECELQLLSLDDAPAYEALSYVWGVDPPSVPIICNGQRLNIRSELSYALARVRLKHATRIIWVDALCIDQTDDEEKSHQVPLMGKIFSHATKVNVWLGRGDEKVIKQAFECSKMIANACKEFSLEHNMDLNDDKTLGAVEIPTTLFTATVYDSLRELFTRPLFSRVWCVQEVLLAQNALLMWGEQELPWKDIGLVATWRMRKWQAAADDKELQDVLEGICIEDVDNMYTFDHVGSTLLMTLSNFRNSESTDPRDKVYGLISLVGGGIDADLMVPDYGKGVAEVYADTALYILTTTQSLLLFAHISHDTDYDGRDGYRSWAPRWDCSRTTSMISNGYTVSGDGACSGRKAEFHFTKDCKAGQLCLTGIVYAAVTTVDSVFDLAGLIEPGGLRRYPQIAKIYEGIDWDDDESDRTLRVLAQTLTTGDSTYNERLKDLDNDSLWAHCERFKRFFEWWRTATSNSNDMRGDAYLYRLALMVRCTNRRFFWTSKDVYGLGPACMREGDIVIVLYGGDAPYVLRPRGDGFLFLGEAYVDSIMNGELVKDVEGGERLEQEFCLI